MSVRTGFAIVGTAIGAYFGNAALGYSIGSMVGGYVDPVKVKGPRITDAQAQTSQDGVPIPITYGGVRISGNIIATGTLQEHKKKDSGKGGGTENITYTYTRTYAIGICEGPIGGIRRIWRDGKLVYDQSEASFGDYESRVSTRQFLSHSTQYLGDEVQTPDSALQAIFGTDNVPAFRGLAYVVIRDDDLTDRAGSIPGWEFEVMQEVTPFNTGELIAAQLADTRWKYPGASLAIDPRNPGALYKYGVRDYGSTTINWYPTEGAALAAIGRGTQVMGWTHDQTVTGGAGSGSNSPVAPYAVLPEPQGDKSATLGLTYSVDPWLNIQNEPLDIRSLTPEMCAGGLYVPDLRNGPGKYGVGVVSNVPLPNTSDVIRVDSGDFYISHDVIVCCQVIENCVTLPDPTWVEIPGTPGFYVDQTGTVHEVGNCVPVTGSFNQLQAKVFNTSQEGFFTAIPLGPALDPGDPNDNEAFWTSAYEQAEALGLMASGLTYPGNYPVLVDHACECGISGTLDPDYPTLASIVADLCLRKGLQGSEIDVAQLTDIVKGFTVATATSAADAINALAPAYSFDAAEWDGRIRFIKRGGATEIALADTDAFDSDEGRVVETRAQELELPRKMTLSYMDLAANYAVTTQSAERYSASVASSGTDQVTLAVVMEADKAAQTADILLKDQWSSINGTLAVSVGDEFSIIVPTDVLFLTYGEAVFRCRAVEVENADGQVKLSLQQDTAGAYSSSVAGVQPRPPVEGNPTIFGPTFAEVLNLPALRDQDDQVGLYLAACGPVGQWRGAQVALSIDGGATWRDVLQLTQSTTMGALSDVLPIWSEHIPDTVHTLEVALTDGDFESATLDAMYAGANPLCVGEEILQFQTQTLTSPKEYVLGPALFRGRKNTDPNAWPTGTRVVDLTGVYFLPLDRSYIGQILSVRFTTFGTDVQYGTIKTIDFSLPKSVQEWPVTDIRSARASDEALTLDWVPRNRLGTSRRPYASSWFTGYLLSFTDGTTTKQFVVSSPTFSYSAVDQVADFGLAGTLTVTLSATNSIIGAGEATTVTV